MYSISSKNILFLLKHPFILLTFTHPLDGESLSSSLDVIEYREETISSGRYAGATGDSLNLRRLGELLFALPRTSSGTSNIFLGFRPPDAILFYNVFLESSFICVLTAARRFIVDNLQNQVHTIIVRLWEEWFLVVVVVVVFSSFSLALIIRKSRELI